MDQQDLYDEVRLVDLDSIEFVGNSRQNGSFCDCLFEVFLNIFSNVRVCACLQFGNYIGPDLGDDESDSGDEQNEDQWADEDERQELDDAGPSQGRHFINSHQYQFIKQC